MKNSENSVLNSCANRTEASEVMDATRLKGKPMSKLCFGLNMTFADEKEDQAVTFSSSFLRNSELWSRYFVLLSNFKKFSFYIDFSVNTF